MGEKTPTYQARTSTPTPGSTPLMRAPNLDVGAGRAAQNLGSGLMEAGASINAVQEQRAAQEREQNVRRESQLALTDGISADGQWSQYAQEAIQSAPADGSGLVDAFDKKFNDFLPKAMESYKTEEGRGRADVVYGRIRQETRGRLLEAQAELLAKDSDRRRREAVSGGERNVTSDPSKYGTTEAMLSGVIAELPGVSAGQKDAAMIAMRKSLGVAAGYGDVSKRPYFVLNELSKDKPALPWAQHIEFDDVLRLRSAAQSEVNRREAEARSAQIEAQASLRGDLSDALAAREVGITSKLPDKSRFTAAFGADGAEKYAEAAHRWSIYDAVAEARFQTPADAQATLARLKPELQSGAAERAQDYDAATRLYAEQRRQLESDPVAVLSQSDPQVRAARDALAPGPDGAQPSPDAIKGYFSTLRARQLAAGIVEPKLLPETQRKSIAATLQAFDPQHPLKRVAVISQLRNSYGAAYPDVMREVAPKLDGLARVLINMEPKDAERLDAAYASKDTFDKTVKAGDSKDIRNTLDQELHDFGATLVDAPDGDRRYAEHLEAATALAQSLVRQGSSSTDAARQAAATVINDQYNFRGELRIPRQFDPNEVLRGADQAKHELAKSGSFLFSGGEQPKDPAGFPIDVKRPVIKNADGTVSTELSMTTGIDGRFYNFPTIWDGKKLSEQAAFARFKDAFDKGAVFPNFSTEEEAIKQARARSNIILSVREKAERAQRDMRAAIDRDGYWATNENGDGVVLRLPHRGGLGDVYRSDGSRVEMSFAALNAAKAPAQDQGSFPGY